MAKAKLDQQTETVVIKDEVILTLTRPEAEKIATLAGAVRTGTLSSVYTELRNAGVSASKHTVTTRELDVRTFLYTDKPLTQAIDLKRL